MDAPCLVPITLENAGFVLRITKLVGVRTGAAEEVDRAAPSARRDREGEGAKRAGFNTLGGLSQGRRAQGWHESERGRGDAGRHKRNVFVGV